MGKEIERKFLVADDSYVDQAYKVEEIAQGYLNTDPDRTVRIRTKDSRGFITVKTCSRGATRGEWEYEIPIEDARELLGACTHIIEKNRYLIHAGNGLKWEVDVFAGRLAGLILAEIELPSEDTPFVIPPFVAAEVTGDPRYYNSNL